PNEQKTTTLSEFGTSQIASESKENVPSQSINLLSKAPLINLQQAPNNLPKFEQSKENVPSQSINLLSKAPLINQQQAPNNLPKFEQSKENQAPNNLPKFEQSKENVPSQSINLLSKAPLINLQQAPNNLPKFEQSKENVPSQSINLLSKAPLINLQQAPNNLPKEILQNSPTAQLPAPTMPDFTQQQPVKTETNLVLPNEKDAGQKTDQMGDNILTSFDREMQEFRESISLINQFDHDPFIKSRYENIKAMYTKFDLEMTDLKERSGYRRYEAKFNNYREIYAKICALDKNVTERNRKLSRLMEQLKSTRVGKNVLHECNLSSPRKKDEENSPYINSILDRIKKKGELNMLSGKMSDLNLDKEMRQKCEKNSKLNSQLYDKLKKRNTVPKQVVNIGQLESIASKYIESKSTQVPLNDTSFLHFNQASPNISRVLDSSVQHKPAQTPIQQMPQLREIHTPIQPKFNQPVFFMNQVHQKENETLTTSTPAPSSSTPFFSGLGQTAKSSIPENLAYAVQQTQPQVVDKPIANFSPNPLIQTEIKAKNSQPQITTSQSHPIFEINKPKPKTTEPKLQEEKKQQPSSHDQKIQQSQTTKQFESKEATKFVMNEMAPKSPEKKDISLPEFNSIRSKPDEVIDKKLAQSSLNPPELVTKNEAVEKKSLIPQLNVAPKQPVKLPEQKNSQLFKTSEASFPEEKKNEPTTLSKPKEQAFASAEVGVKPLEPVNLEKKSSTSKINFGSNQLAGQDLVYSGTNFATGDSKSAARNSFGPGFADTSGNIFGAKTESKPAFSSTFSLTKPANTPSHDKEKEQSNIGLDAGQSDQQFEKKEKFGIEQSENIKQQNAKEKDVKATESPDSNSPETDKKNELLGVSTSIPLFQSENLTKSNINRNKKEDKKTETNLSGLLQGNKLPVFDKPSFSTSASSQFSFNLNQVKGEDKTDNVENAENTKPVVEEPKNEKSSVQETTLFGSRTNFLTEQKSADQTKEPARQNENLFTSFSGDPKPAAGNSFGSGFANTSVSIFGAKTESKQAFPSTFSSAKPADNPFAAIASQKQSAAETDADMDSSSVVSSNNGLSFGGFGLGSSKPINEPTKNIFGGAQFSASFTKETPKPAFGGSVIKNATFSTSTQQTTGATGFGNISSSSTISTGGNLFSTFNSPTKPTFGATPTFGGSPGFGQPAAFGGPATFGAASAFGANSAFASTSTTANTPTFGALSSGAAPGFGGFVQSSSNTENAFGTLAAQNQSGSLFSSFT
ncbi:nuclear pore complex protein Nup214-like, partial [Brachionus plicatilis]